MATAENALIEYESGQTLNDYEALTDSGDATEFTSSEELWSGKSGKTPTVRPNGLVTGGVISVGTGSNTVNVAALTCYLAGVLKTVSASTGETVTRGTSAFYVINSITVTAAGAIAVIAGTEGSEFSATRGAAGGAPWIPSGSIEIGQVRFTTEAAAAVTAAEIKQVVGTHQERYDYPLWDVNYINVTGGSLGNAGVEFYAEMDKIHSDDTGTTTATKKVYASFYAPEFTSLSKSSDFVPPETSHSVSSTQIYGTTIGSSSSSLGQGSFTAYLSNGIDDPLIKEKNQNLWFKFRADRLEEKYIYAQGKLGIGRTFPADDQIQAACTLSAETEAVEVYA
jgi:hypothetical protein